MNKYIETPRLSQLSFNRVHFAPTRVWFRNKKIVRSRRKQCTLSEESLFIIGETDNRNQIFGYLDRISQKWVEAERKLPIPILLYIFCQKKCWYI